MSYYILSLKRTKGSAEYVWWKPNDCGYTKNLNEAGIYTEHDVLNNYSYYNNINTMPVEMESVNRLFSMKTVPATSGNYNMLNIGKHLEAAGHY